MKSSKRMTVGLPKETISYMNSEIGKGRYKSKSQIVMEALTAWKLKYDAQQMESDVQENA
jgi:Arc/MetJ-type ribon-helix-helix transcriptional regulator